MQIEMMQAKLHRACVTDACLDYMGSLTVDVSLMEKVGLVPNQKVQIANIRNGARLETYVIPGEAGKKEIIANGAAAHLVQKGDRVIIIAYCSIDTKEALNHQPKVLILDENNNTIQI